MKGICEYLELEPPAHLSSVDSLHAPNGHKAAHGDCSELENDGACELSPPASPSAAHAPIDTFLGAGKPDSNVDTSSPRRARKRTNANADIIGKGIVSLETAQLLVQQYLSRLDYFLYALCSQYKDLDSIRQASPVLLAAICAVSAFHNHEHQELFDACNREYRQLVATALFEKKDTEHIRALCIGSFWLPDASRILSSDAIRRAADSRLHQQFPRADVAMMEGQDISLADESHTRNRDSVRLWYLLFICDQHLSILHNRDGLMRKDHDILDHRDSILLSPGHTSQDIRLLSQCSLLVIMSEIRDVLGSEGLKPVPKSLSPHFSHFARELDQWYARFSTMFSKQIFPRIQCFC